MFFINVLKIIFLLGCLVFIHEGGLFLMAKLCKIRVNEFAIGFGPTIWRRQGKTTLYALRAIPLGGFVKLEGEEEESTKEGSFSEASTFKKVAIVAAGGLVNIIFAIIVFWLLSIFVVGINNSLPYLKIFIQSMIDSVVQLFTGKASVEQMMGPIGLSNVISKTSGIEDFVYILSVISLSLGVTNLLPVPPLDGGKIVLLIIEGIRRKPLTTRFKVIVQSAGFLMLITLSLFVAYKDILEL